MAFYRGKLYALAHDENLLVAVCKEEWLMEVNALYFFWLSERYLTNCSAFEDCCLILNS